jgi:hypothetical protein
MLREVVKTAVRTHLIQAVVSLKNSNSYYNRTQGSLNNRIIIAGILRVIFSEADNRSKPKIMVSLTIRRRIYMEWDKL